MYSARGVYRLRFVATTGDGTRRVIAPSALARFAGADEAPYLTGAETFRRASNTWILRRRVEDLAALACRVDAAREVEATLDERRAPEDPIRSISRTVRCDVPGER